jgi:hypothetical protein
MKMCARFLAVALAFASIARADTEATTGAPSWQDEIARGYMPYKQLKVEDFPINDQSDPGNAFTIKTFVHSRPHLLIKPGDGIVDVAIDQWLVFSGLDRNLSWRKSAFKEMKENLPCAQALLDINEIYARRLGALKLTDLPQVRSTNIVDASAELNGKLKELVDANQKEIQAEQEAFAKATDGGHNAKKVREKAAEIRKRLEATTPATVPYPQPPSSTGSPKS